MSWQLILKEIPFKVRDFRAIDKKAKKIWNDGGRKEKLSEIIVRLIREKYNTSDEELMEDFRKYLETLSGYAQTSRVRSKQKYDRFEERRLLDENDPKYRETVRELDERDEIVDELTELFGTILAQDTTTPDEEIIRQFDKFKDRLEREEKKRELKDTTPKKRRRKTKPKIKTGKLDSFEDSFPKSAKMFREWVESSYFSISFSKLNRLLSLVGSPTIGNDETIGRLKKFIKDEEMNDKDKTALSAIADQMVKENNEKPRSNRRLSGNVVQARALGLDIAKRSSLNKTNLVIRFGDNQKIEIKGKQRNFLDNFERLDLTNDSFYNNENTRDIFKYWVKESGYTGSPEKFIKLDPLEKSKYIKNVMRNIPEYPTNHIKVGLLYRDMFEDNQAGLISDKDKAPEEFAYFLQGLRDGLMGGKSARTAFDFNILKKFNNRILPQLIDAIKRGVFVDAEGERQFRLGPPVSKLMNRLSKDQEDKSEIISVIGDVIRGQNISNKYQGSDKDTLAKIESDIRDQLKEKVAGKTVASYLLSTFTKLYKKEGILSSILNTKTVIPVEYLKPSDVPERESPMGKKPKYKPDPNKKVEPPKDLPKAGKKLFEWVDRETERLQAISDDKENDITYTEEDIHRMVGWKKGTVKEIKRTISGEIVRDEDGNPVEVEREKYIKYNPKKETKKSLDNLLVAIGEEDEIIIKEDIGLILESLNKKQKKKVKAILNIADPTEYFGHDFLKLSELIRLLKTLGVVKGDKKLNKKILRYDEENVKVVKLAARLRKDYERLYDDLREMIYPKSGE
tara:strand:+ start:29837 stop:32218 length:2382 start_codon:yes stop_codon:yes gene_type:complete